MKETKSEWYEQLYDYHMKCRHYNDEYKAFEKNSYRELMAVMRESFRLLYRVNLETGNVTVPKGYTEKDYESMLNRLKAAENGLIPLRDPKEDKIFLWDRDNIPWDRISRDEWERISYDAPDFVPHLVPFLVEGQETRPAVIVMAGSTRLNLPEGYPPAEFLNRHGYQAFVLNNRIAHGAEARKSMNRALDLQRAIRLVRSRAEEYRVDPENIFIFCCSLGNRAAIDMINRLGIRRQPVQLDPEYLPDEIDRSSASVKGYVSLYPAAFLYDDQINYKDFPPVFAVMGNEDKSLWRMMPFFSRLIAGDVRVELHLYDGAGHGFSLADEKFAMGETTASDEAYKEWTHLLLLWMERQLKS